MGISREVPRSQFEYLGRWVDKDSFRAFVYNHKDQKLAESYDEFIALIGSGLWFETKEFAEQAYKTSQSKKPQSQGKLKIAATAGS